MVQAAYINKRTRPIRNTNWNINKMTKTPLQKGNRKGLRLREEKDKKNGIKREGVSEFDQIRPVGTQSKDGSEPV